MIAPADGSVPLFQPADPATEFVDPPPVSKGPELSFDLGNGVKMEVVKINAKGKSFLMGSPEGEKGRQEVEKQHQITFGHDYYIGKLEVTRVQYLALMGELPMGRETQMQYPSMLLAGQTQRRFVRS